MTFNRDFRGYLWEIRHHYIAIPNWLFDPTHDIINIKELIADQKIKIFGVLDEIYDQVIVKRMELNQNSNLYQEEIKGMEQESLSILESLNCMSVELRRLPSDD